MIASLLLKVFHMHTYKMNLKVGVGLVLIYKDSKPIWDMLFKEKHQYWAGVMRPYVKWSYLQLLAER